RRASHFEIGCKVEREYRKSRAGNRQTSDGETLELFVDAIGDQGVRSVAAVIFYRLQIRTGWRLRVFIDEQVTHVAGRKTLCGLLKQQRRCGCVGSIDCCVIDLVAVATEKRCRQEHDCCQHAVDVRSRKMWHEEGP